MGGEQQSGFVVAVPVVLEFRLVAQDADEAEVLGREEVVRSGAVRVSGRGVKVRPLEVGVTKLVNGDRRTPHG